MRRRRVFVAAALLALSAAGCGGKEDGREGGREGGRKGGLACPPARMVLDIGHTPEAPGAIAASGATELSFNIRFADRLAHRLTEAGLATGMIRIDGDDPLLKRRVAAIAAYEPALIVSIHHDSVQERHLRARVVDGVERTYTDQAAGFSTFVPAETPHAGPSLETARRIADALHAVGERPSLHHAEAIEGEGRRLLDAARGIYAGDFLKLLRTAPAPAVLVEVGVIKNPAEERRLADPATVDALAGAMAAAILSAPCPAIGR